MTAAALVRLQEVRHPYHTLTQPIRLANEARLARLPRAFIRISSPSPPGPLSTVILGGTDQGRSALTSWECY